ncbi:MAG: metallophosphoesterase [Acidobacteria bacterium]|nr:metallophosphoesterase [Acidobacteriota bacterium]MCI0620268.1 metallophosphoesterase [Acidobacteriota bacterium]MCI0722972.1 metallophosphoesterase [Acidobacteriota bacterium]
MPPRRFWVAAVLILVTCGLFGQPQAGKIPRAVVKMHLAPELQQAPGSFSLKAAGEPIRVLAFGDFGDGSKRQREVAAAMLQYHQKQKFDFAVTLGDNFYSKGMKGVDDPRWKTWWDQLYDPLGIQFYATLGNHDYGFPQSPEAEILYSKKSPSWRMPAARYTFTAGWVQFFAIDSQVLSTQQLDWLRQELDASKFRWKVVYGHHPIYSHGQHGDSPRLIRDLLPILKGRADVYLTGHDHDMQHLKPEGNLHFFVSGSGGKQRPIRPGPRSLFAKSALGFAMLEADGLSLKITFIEKSLTPLYEYTLKK